MFHLSRKTITKIAVSQDFEHCDQVQLGYLHTEERSQLYAESLHQRAVGGVQARPMEFLYVVFRASNGPHLTRIAVRLENEHVGNMDQYRVTREVPLPYSFDDAANESDADDDERKSISSWRSRRRAAKAQASQDVYRIGTELQS